MPTTPDVSDTVPTLSKLFRDIFGLDHPIESLIRCFDFGPLKDDAKKTDGPEHTLTFALAPSFGELTHEHLKELDKHLQIIIGATTINIRKLAPEERTWEKILEIMVQDPLLEEEGTQIIRADRLTEATSTWRHFSEARDDHILRTLESWFCSLLLDEDVQRATPIKIRDIAEVIAATAAPLTILTTNTHNEKKIVDIGVLRYPDVKHPYFKLYRIQLQSWAFISANLGIENKKSGVSGNYNCSRFKPSAEAFKMLPQDSLKKALRVVEDMFADYPLRTGSPNKV